MFDMKFEAYWLDARWIFDIEIFVYENIGIAKKHGLLVGIECELLPFGIGVEFCGSVVKTCDGVVDGAIGCVECKQSFKR